MTESRQRNQDRDLTEYVYDAILAHLNEHGSIISERLSVSSLAREFGVSRTPVVLALTRLESEGLVRRDTGEGWATLSLGLKDIEEIFELKKLLEPYLARIAAERASPEDIEALLAAVGDMQEAAKLGDTEKWREADNRFHCIQHDILGNQRIKHLLARYSSQLHHLASSTMVLEHRMKTASGIHRKAAEAIAARDPDLAGQTVMGDLENLEAYATHLLQNIVGPLLGRAY